MEWEGIVEAAILKETKDTDLVIFITITSILEMVPHLRGREEGRELQREGGGGGGRGLGDGGESNCVKIY